MRYAVVIAILMILSTENVHAQSGRWHIQTTSGDQPAQIATGKPVTFDAAFVCNGTACGGVQVFLRDFTICDVIGFENISSGLDISGSNAAFQFAVGGTAGLFTYTFEGTLAETFVTITGGSSVSSATVTGMYGSTPGGCNNGTATNQGTFVANWYPPITGTYVGVLEPAHGNESPIGLELVLTQEADGSLMGEVLTGSDLRFGTVFKPSQNSCFSSARLAITQGPGKNTSDASGNSFEIFAVDTIGSSIHLQGVAREVGSNTSYIASYEIMRGVCDGQVGTGASFMPATATSPPATQPPQPRLLMRAMAPALDKLN